MQTFFFFNDTATTEIYTLSLHDALPISHPGFVAHVSDCLIARPMFGVNAGVDDQPHRAEEFVTDRKSTRLNSSHGYISYAVFCLKKKIHPRMRIRSSILNYERQRSTRLP